MIRGFGSSEVRIGVRTMRCQPSLRDLEVLGGLFPALKGWAIVVHPFGMQFRVLLPAIVGRSFGMQFRVLLPSYCRSSLRDAVSVSQDSRIFTACASQSER